MLRHTGAQLDWLVLSDSTLHPRHRHGRTIVIRDDRLDQAAHRRARRDTPPGNTPEHAEALREYVEGLADYRNRDGGFWVASTDPLAALAEHGPTELIRQVRTAEQSEPHSERWPRSKPHDDATAAYCQLWYPAD